MSRKSFECILLFIHYTYIKGVDYNDGFFHMSQMEESWNMNMAEEFNSSWINVMDKIMIKWFNKYAPGFMCVGIKPLPFINESHKIYFGLTPILLRYQIVEGKYIPPHTGQKEYNELGKTVSLILSMCRPILGSG